jgi:hypothetical protein
MYRKHGRCQPPTIVPLLLIVKTTALSEDAGSRTAERVRSRSWVLLQGGMPSPLLAWACLSSYGQHAQQTAAEHATLQDTRN